MSYERYSLEPDRTEMARLGQPSGDRSIDFVERLQNGVAFDAPAPGITELVRAFLAPPAETIAEPDALPGRPGPAYESPGYESNGAGYASLLAGASRDTGVLGDLYQNMANRHSSPVAFGPVLTALEDSVINWIAQEVVGLPATSGGLLTSGASAANLSAVVAARDYRLGEELSDGTIYVTERTHHSMAKVAQVAGIRKRNIRVVPSSLDLRMDVDAAAEMIAKDQAVGLLPFMIVASVGSDGGSVDPLVELAGLAHRENLWLHVDAACGGFYRLTERGRARLAGLELADSVTLDPHKALAMPIGIGTIVVRDRARLGAKTAQGSWSQDPHSVDAPPDYAALGPELTREVRGLRAWLPLHLHGVGALRAELDEKLDLAELVQDKLSSLPTLELPWRPELSTVVFRVRPSEDDDPTAVQDADRATCRLLERINAGGRIVLSSTVIEDRQTINMCIRPAATPADRVPEAIDIITAAAMDLALPLR